MKEHGFAWLLVAIIVFLFGLPIAEELGTEDSPLFRVAIFSCLLLIGVWSLRGAGKVYLTGMAFAVAGVLLNLAGVGDNADVYFVTSFIAILGFLFTAIWHTLKVISRADETDFDRLVGAVCLYLLLGLAWAIVYGLLNWVSPDSFAGLPESRTIHFHSAFIYFSFVTMTTLGFGDIVPLTPILRTVAYLQAIVGQFYLAILVASLVSAYINAANEKRR